MSNQDLQYCFDQFLSQLKEIERLSINLRLLFIPGLNDPGTDFVLP